MFWKKKESSITTTITKTSSQAQHEQEVYNQAVSQSRVCPECGRLDNDTFKIGAKDGVGNKYFYGECVCGAEWQVKYRY